KETDQILKKLYIDQNDQEIVKQVSLAAEENNVSMAQISLAWILSRPGIISPIIGVTRMEHLHQAIEAVDLKIDIDYFNSISEVYSSRPVIGHSYDSLLS
ncbi:MAG: aldo/keto reductase, partial [Candidatus Heimdallarchaeota archaeon]